MSVLTVRLIIKINDKVMFDITSDRPTDDFWYKFDAGQMAQNLVDKARVVIDPEL